MPGTDPGYGPPPGNPTGPARGGGVPFEDLARAGKFAQGFSAPGLNGVITGDEVIDKARVKLVYRDIPLVTIQNAWSVDQARGALYAHLIGIFDASAQLCDSILGDDRVTACLNSKATALFGRELRTRPAEGRAKGSAAAKECHDAWADHCPILFADSAIREMQDYSCLMGWSHSQAFWVAKPGLSVGVPVLRPWHPRFEYYDWTVRRYMAITQDGTIPIVPGNGKWVEHAPWGPYRGWVRGAIRPVCEPWMLRHFGFRDMARFGEVHGNPTRKGLVPAVGDPVERASFEQALANLGADTALIVPRGVDGQNGTGYDYELVEAESQAWQVHPAQIDRCDMAIVLALLMVNLTTEVDGGSYAAANAHMDVRAGGTQFDNRAWLYTLYTQLARPFAYLNFGDADLAPWTDWDVIPTDEYANNAKQWGLAAAGLNQMAQAGMRFDDPEEVREWMVQCFGLKRFPKFKLVEPKVSGAGAEEKGEGSAGQPRPKLKAA